MKQCLMEKHIANLSWSEKTCLEKKGFVDKHMDLTPDYNCILI